MTTPVMMPVIWVMLQFYPGAGTAVPTPKVGNTSVMATFLTRELCEGDRASRRTPEDYFCVEYRSEKFIDYTFPQDTKGKTQPDRQGTLTPPDIQTKNDDVQLAGGHYHRSAPLWLWVQDDNNGVKLAGKDRPFIEPLVAAEPAPKKRVVTQRRQQQQFNPIGAFLAFLPPRDNW
jgi:hypothetical protein